MLQGTPVGDRIPSEYFGMHLLHADDTTPYGAWTGQPQTPFHPLGYGSFRIWDVDCTWRQLETSKGVFDWTRMDKVVANAKAAGCSIMYTLGQAPFWATGGVGGGSNAVFPRYNSTPPFDFDDWDDYITAIVTRYADDIDAYEIWNEWTLEAFWLGTVEQLVELTQRASVIIRSIAPTAKIIGASSHNFNWLVLLSEYLKDAHTYIDAAGFHSYISSPPEVMFTSAQKLRGYLNGIGLNDLPIWDTEFSYLGIDITLASTYIIRSMILMRLAGCERAFFWQMGHPSVSVQLIDPNSVNTILAAGEAYAFMCQMLIGGHVWNFAQAGHLYSVNVRYADGTHGRILWADDDATVSHDISGAQSAFTMTGDPITLSASYAVTRAPIYIVT